MYAKQNKFKFISKACDTLNGFWYQFMIRLVLILEMGQCVRDICFYWY